MKLKKTKIDQVVNVTYPIQLAFSLKMQDNEFALKMQKNEIAKEMIIDDETNIKIAKYTKLTEVEIEALRNELNNIK